MVVDFMSFFMSFFHFFFHFRCKFFLVHTIQKQPIWICTHNNELHSIFCQFRKGNRFHFFQLKKLLLKCRRAPQSCNLFVVPDFLCPETVHGCNKWNWNLISINREKLVILARDCIIFHFPMGGVRNEVMPRTWRPAGCTS